MQTSLKVEETSDIPRDLSSWSNNVTHALEGITWRRRGAAKIAAKICFENQMACFSETIFTLGTLGESKRKLQSILSGMINTEFS